MPSGPTVRLAICHRSCSPRSFITKPDSHNEWTILRGAGQLGRGQVYVSATYNSGSTFFEAEFEVEFPALI